MARPVKILSFVGTRPEIIKTLAFVEAAKHIPSLEFKVAHSGQNFGPRMAGGFFEELGIPLDERNAEVDRSSLGSTMRCLTDFVSDTARKHKPDILISNTDTDTAYCTAWVGARMRLPVAHIEGGIRCEERLNPEELNRKLADHLSNWVFTISDQDTRTLAAEGYPSDQIFMFGDITLDTLNHVVKRFKIEIRTGDYDLLTIHRQENANHPDRLASIFEAVREGGIPTVFPIHPRTQDQLERSGVWERLKKIPNIRTCEPEGYPDMLRLVAGARKVLSDSGGLRRESYMLGKPVIALVGFVWFHEMNRLGFEYSAGADKEKILWAIRNFEPQGPRPPVFGDGRAAERILAKLAEKAR